MAPRIRWAYGVTTVPERKDGLLPRTLESLRTAGFDCPRLFVDGENEIRNYEHFGLPMSLRFPRLRPFGNWIVSLWELYLREPRTDLYAIFQDDMVTYRNLRQYLETIELPDHGYFNLYTFPRNQRRVDKGYTGWFMTDQLGKGAVGLVFKKECAIELLASKHMAVRPLDTHRGWRALDGAVVTALKKVEPIPWREYCHTPSLVQHTGMVSSLKNRPHVLAESFMGEDFDAMELLQWDEENNGKSWATELAKRSQESASQTTE